ncbi:protein kinase domain-containing protein [Colletotrichum graminicola M1.001]|uniref:Protein kinase domain-containing protein n=1 Tax=Colletotrichum graminicola (strain M1.001 / M2 / FGSC 10212) TaxID=645133 RepID=E3Q3T1_COLGM|nr:protein kinase domain-containing protein [Colletotrichum graminicola M1.001]EFQ25683.1 protein kinase domain-containing protein [Colletotrichum graminicola M1.001]
MSRIRLIQPDGTEVDIEDTGNNHARNRPDLEAATSWRNNGGSPSTIPQDVPRGIPSDGQTEINDHGDTAQLKAETTKSESKVPRSSKDDISHVGGAPGLDDREPGMPFDVSESESELDYDDLWDSIDEQLIEPPPENGRKYLPLDQLRKIMVKPRVRQELKKLKGMDQDTIHRYANAVCDTTDYGTMQRTTRHKMFATLVHIEHIEALSSFIDEKIHDVHLPFILQKKPRWHLTYTTTDRTTNEKITAKFQGSYSWSKAKMNSFVDHQWLFMAPFFDMKANKPPFYPLEARVVLPFRKEEKCDPAYGGFSTVSRTHIHEAHHNSKHANRAAFERELHAMKKFNRQGHPHLMKLLATYQYQQHWYFIFPWANGNLREFWQQHHTPQPDHQLVVWIADQITGIASGLKLIQHPPKDPTLTQDARDSGRHGDLRPENVLWFRDHDKDKSIIGSGVLKIADFGLTSYHHHSSRYDNAKDVNFAQTYKAPEVDVAEEVSQPYDIWTLGCLLLEFVTWYLKGWQGVDEFSGDRAKNDAKEDEIPLDTFYNIIMVDGVKQAVLKPTVKELLTYISDHLLRIDPKKRQKCLDVANTMKQMAGDFKQNQEYAVSGCKPPNKSGTTEITRTEKTVPDYGHAETEFGTQTTLVGSRDPSPKRSEIPQDHDSVLPNSTKGHNGHVVYQNASIEYSIETPNTTTTKVIPIETQTVSNSGGETKQSDTIENGGGGDSKRRGGHSAGKRSTLWRNESTLVETGGGGGGGGEMHVMSPGRAYTQ